MTEGPRPDRAGHVNPVAARREISRALSGRMISLANLIRCPVLEPTGKRVGRLDDVGVRWDSGAAHPPVVAVLVKAGRTLAEVAASDVILDQRCVRLQSAALVVATPVRREAEIALARDVLDHQLVDVAGVQVVRAADVYLANTGIGWELAGVDVGQWALMRRNLPRRKTCPPPDRSIDWADLQAFVPRFSDAAVNQTDSPATSAGTAGSSVQLAQPAAELHRLRAKDVVALLSGLGRGQQAQLATLANSSTVAEALGEIDPAKLDALLAELEPADQAKLLALMPEKRTQ